MGRVKSRMKRFAAVVLSLAVMVPVGVFGTSPVSYTHLLCVRSYRKCGPTGKRAKTLC